MASESSVVGFSMLGKVRAAQQHGTAARGPRSKLVV